MTLLKSIIDHAVLPPKLPGEREDNYQEISDEILKRLVRACEAAKSLASPPFADAFQSLSESLQAAMNLNRGQLERETLIKHFSQLQPNTVLICYVVEQNAAVLIRRENDQNNHQSVVIECFEASPTTEHVLAADNALEWDFPGRAVRLSLSDFNDENLQKNLSIFLDRASMESIHGLQAKAHKANVSISESRDTSNPGLISEMLMVLLEAIGEFAHVTKLKKRVRDDVNFDTGLLPWRRLPFWLILRVAAQRYLHLSLGGSGRACYKLLMGIFFSQLLQDSTNELVSLNKTDELKKNLRLDPSMIITLRTKLCRRMVKLEQEKANLTTDREYFERTFSRVAPKIRISIEVSNDRVEKLWSDFKRRTIRKVETLRQRASEKSLQLSLTKSGSYLKERLKSHKSPTTSSKDGPLDLPKSLEKPVQEIQNFTSKIFQLAHMERKFELDISTKGSTIEGAQARFAKTVNGIRKVFLTVGETYDGDPILQSVKILTIFELWMGMDECSLMFWPLLGDYKPIFVPELLDALQLPTLPAMKRLLVVQRYLANRHAKAQHGHIFSNLGSQVFANRYVKQTKEMRELKESILASSDANRIARTQEWETKTAKYEEHTVEMELSICSCIHYENSRSDSHGCKKHFHERSRKRITVQNHEDFLPNDEARSHMIVFELGIPLHLSIYRDETWKIFRDLAHPARLPFQSPSTTLRECPHLQDFMAPHEGRISFASKKKCFIQTHYKFSTGLVPLEKIMLPFAADFQPYDQEAKIWVQDLFKTPPTLHHLCGVHVPVGLSSTVLRPQVHPAMNFDGPSSYEIQANITKCPPNMSVAEFSAYQKLLAGKSRRWLNILVELGSSNLNFSSEDTTLLLSQLAVQAGPCVQEGSDDLRDVHSVFKEREFVQQLKNQIQIRLDSIYTNWRETNCMELLINLSLRAFSLSTDDEMRSQFIQLLISAREATLTWITSSQEESRRTTNKKDSDWIATYGLKASLLCRRTFEINLSSQTDLSAMDLATWIRASIALQENPVMRAPDISDPIRSNMIHDAKMAFSISSMVQAAVNTHPQVIEEVISIVWKSITTNAVQSTSSWSFLPPPRSNWIQYIVPGDHEHLRSQQVLHLHILEGHFLVNGKRRGNLPHSFGNDPSVKLLFGDCNLRVYASALLGMEYTLVDQFERQLVHLGMRNSRAVIRTEGKNGLFEFVPREIFESSGTWDFDLPLSLLNACTHWLNLNTGILEVRRHPSTWNRRPRDWRIDVNKRRATRGEKVSLVDPRSSEFRQIARTFEHFEVPRKLTVFQSCSQRGKLSVELRHLDLEFHVNSSGLLFCKQLRANIDIDQDAGTWYGLASKIALRDAADKSRRSIIIPNGKLSRRIHLDYTGIHVSTSFQASDGYLRFDIDQTLGRLSSQPEPLLLYRMALCHAVTSFCLPDPLTGVTGTEEAVRILQSGAAQPWSPSSFLDLEDFAFLLPQREYYPRDLKRLQRVAWNSHLTTTIQSDQFEGLIREIERQAGNLAEFSPITNDQEKYVTEETPQLRLRAQRRRLLYERTTEDTANLSQSYPIYRSRDRQATPRASRVHKVADMIHSRSLHINMNRSVKEILDKWHHIGGFDKDHTLLDTASLRCHIESDIREIWGSLIKLCCSENDQLSLTFRLCLLVFNGVYNLDIVLSLGAFCYIKELQDLAQPTHSGYEHFRDREPPSVETVQKLISKSFLRPPATTYDDNQRRKEQAEYKKMCEDQGITFARLILGQWPELPVALSAGDISIINVSSALKAIRPEWDRRKQNMQLAAYVDQVDAILGRYRTKHRGAEFPRWPATWRNNLFFSLSCFKHRNIVPSISQDLVTKAGPELIYFNSYFSTRMMDFEAQSNRSRETPAALSENFTELHQILDSFSQSPNALRQTYGSDLLRSLASLQSINQTTSAIPTQYLPEAEEVTNAIETLQEIIDAYRESIRDAFWSDDARLTWLTLGDMLPCRTQIEILRLLQTQANHQFGSGMKEALIRYGCAIAEIQRLRRLRTAILLEDHRAITEELHNVGHENWDPVEESPDWLLLEIDSNILIRTDQIDVTRAIIKPVSGQNSVLQMNMGRGKTSCIMPMAAAILADGHNVCRLIVPKSLITQTANMIHSRLGGLVGRKVYHIPFSRQTPTTDNMLQLYEQLHVDIQKSRGLILTSHEHVLSFRLSGLLRLADDKLKAAKMMINFQRWLDTHCRDILDECDFTLSPKTQLNYPSGSEKTFDGHPFRWQVAEGILSMVSGYIPRLQASFHGSIERLAGFGRYPAVQFLRSDVEDELHRLIVDDVAGGKSPILHIEHNLHEDTRMAIKRVLSDKSFDAKAFEKATSCFPNPDSTAKILLVVRGLITRKILVLCLSKRWNVQYGLHPNRPPLAVPFAAKGVPSELSEYGHPDVTILLTCLSFYSAGLSYEQFLQGLKSVLTSEDAESEYEKWASESTLPPYLQHCTLINLDDESQMRLLWNLLRRTQAATNYYMNKFVFPSHARQFTIKLQASAWDIPRDSGEKTACAARTTGFSGTNDNKYLLPMNIKQEDLPGLMQTNAEVLSYLLQPRNRRYSVLIDRNLRRLSEHDVLKKMHDKNIRILIDAGAYIIEMGNRELAQLWLRVDGQAQAAVYFRSDNRAWVSFRDPAKQDMPLLATRLANNLENCLVYFDEAHTRGTILCKAMHMSIKDICHNRLPITPNIESSHVIFWLLEQTCRANEDLQPLFQAQGFDFCRRSNAVLQYPKFLTSEFCKYDFLEMQHRQEHMTLMQMYGDTPTSVSKQHLGSMCSSRLQEFTNKLSKYDNTVIWKADAFSEIEQERELETQLETEREVQKPVHYEALNYPGLSAAILDFFKTGNLNTSSEEIFHAFGYIEATEVGRKHDIRDTKSKLFVSKEFSRTIVLSERNYHVGDCFLRPVEWILWSPSTETALVIIPEEAEHLIPKLRRAGDETKIHLIAYAAPIARAMISFNQLRYYSLPLIPPNATLPAWLKIELGILSGRLYTNYEEWKLMDDYVRGPGRSISINPMFLHEWLAVRCRAHDILQTPMGYICQGRTATETHPFFAQPAIVVTPTLPAVQIEDAVEEAEDETWEEEDSDDEDGSLYVDEAKDGSVEKRDSAEEGDSDEEDDSDEEGGSNEKDDGDDEYWTEDEQMNNW
ncbi:hypothetical protein CFAM422_011134 [Trichoderma lentiforme]|uniref:ubiquitinyl hydrolase 1 n=1 Tax=Trichoderma lentiforme TaxID=1567552 RepID=A0A9P4X6D0_9HYPO|nr:hypothetical protein CFAM422_011134 [Trichoderma lentiforme]